jgi:ElaB/YqjD/DUF883 family membrane-anchored ribosome-binding protein
MRSSNWGMDHTADTAAGFRNPETSTGFERMRHGLADTLQRVADGLGDTAAAQDAQSGLAQYGKHASKWLDHSAECVRQFDVQQVDVRVRGYVRQNPGRSLLIASGVGLMIGTILRRR